VRGRWRIRRHPAGARQPRFLVIVSVSLNVFVILFDCALALAPPKRITQTLTLMLTITVSEHGYA
jgi:hypothetical protein